MKRFRGACAATGAEGCQGFALKPIQGELFEKSPLENPAKI